MVQVVFTANIQRHVTCPPVEVPSGTVREVLESVFADNDTARGYVFDDRGALRRHMNIFIDGEPIHDRERLTDVVPEGTSLYIMQALSGG